MSAPRQHLRPLQQRTDFLVDLVVGDLLRSPDGIQGRTLRLPTGQVGTFSRASAGAGVDSAGASYDAPDHYPAISVSSDRGGIPLRPASGPRALETLVVDHPGRIVPHSGYLRFVDRGAGGLSNSRYMQWGDANPRLVILRGSGGPAANWSTVDSNVQSTGLSHPASGVLVQLWWRLRTTGRVQVIYQHGSDAVVEATESSPGVIPPQVPSDPVITLGGGPGGTFVGGIDLEAFRIHADPEASLDVLRGGSGISTLPSP